MSLAEIWLDQATSFPRVSTTVAAWSRAEWIEQTMPVWRRLVEPVAVHIADAMEGALSFGSNEEAAGLPGMAGMEKMLRPMLRTSGASMFGLQLGQGLGHLATECSRRDRPISACRSGNGPRALLPTNIKAFGEGLEQSSEDVTLYLALRECARQRLFASAGWLRSQMLALVEQYASGITIDTSALEQAVGQLDASNLEELTSSLEGGMFEPQKTPEQLATLERLETMLALVEGWVDEVVTQATAQWMPSAVVWPKLCAGPVPRRSGRGDVRHAGGTRAAAAPDARCCKLWGRCATPAGSMAGTPSGRIPTSCPHQLILTIRWALSRETRSEGEENGDFDTALEELLGREQRRRRESEQLNRRPKVWSSAVAAPWRPGRH